MDIEFNFKKMLSDDPDDKAWALLEVINGQAKTMMVVTQTLQNWMREEYHKRFELEHPRDKPEQPND